MCFLLGVFFLAGTEVVSFFLRQFGSCWGWIHGTCNDGKTSRKRCIWKTAPLFKGAQKCYGKVAPIGMTRWGVTVPKDGLDEQYLLLEWHSCSRV